MKFYQIIFNHFSKSNLIFSNSIKAGVLRVMYSFMFDYGKLLGITSRLWDKILKYHKFLHNKNNLAYIYTPKIYL